MAYLGKGKEGDLAGAVFMGRGGESKGEGPDPEKSLVLRKTSEILPRSLNAQGLLI